MANSGDGNNKKGGSSPDKRGASGSDPKKPTPIIDLKATEVKSKADKVDQPSTTPPTAGASASSSSSVPKAGGKDDKTIKSGPDTSKTATDSKSQPSASTASSSQSGSSASPKKTEEKSARPTGPGQDNSGHDKKTSTSAAPAAAVANQARSGGGFFGLVTHVLAGIVGGALVLFGAQPIEKELGVVFIPRAEFPEEYKNRLVALESRPASTTTEGAAGDVAGLAEKLEAAELKLASLSDLAKRVDDLAATRASQSASTSKDNGTSAPASTAAPAANPEVLQRITKLEQTLKSLASSTDSSGNSTDLGRLATISGRVADIESTLKTQISALRDGLSKQLEEKVNKTAEVSAAARAGTERLDNEFATFKTDAARLGQRTDNLKATQDTLDQAVRVAREEAAKLRADLDGLKKDVTQNFQSVARPTDVKSAIEPVSSALAALQSQIKSVVASESARISNAQRIVMALELGNLKRVLDRGGAYRAELQEVKRLSGGKVDLAALEKFQNEGVPTAANLHSEFTKLAHSIIRSEDAPAGDTVFDRIVDRAKSLVRIRRADLPASDKSTEAVVSRIDERLRQGNLVAALDQAKELSDKARQPAQQWLDRVAARADVDRAIASLERQLKSSLGSNAATKG
ncbi:MAG: hypothetical protein AAGB04_10470 [Pseudomonadota bacterium]